MRQSPTCEPLQNFDNFREDGRGGLCPGLDQVVAHVLDTREGGPGPDNQALSCHSDLQHLDFQIQVNYIEEGPTSYFDFLVKDELPYFFESSKPTIDRQTLDHSISIPVLYA